MRKILATLLVFMLCISGFLMPETLHAEDEDTPPVVLGTPIETYEDTIIHISVNFTSVGRQFTYNFPYSDDWFKRNDNTYNHKLCQGSLGLTIAAFRFVDNELAHQGDSLILYYQDAGFKNIETYQYEQDPGEDTIANGIASKKIDDFTLLAVGVCGSGYRNEWCSNLSIGDDARHEGFNSAAKQVEQRIDDYIKKYNITGKIKVWISGFSRASAVSNLVGADLTDSGKYEGVFGYHFAVPNNTTEENHYNNLFCIVGKNDPVPYVAFNEWGYHRFGNVYYTPSKETDSDYRMKLEKAAKIFEEVSGEIMIASPAINKSLRLALMNFLDVVPTSDTYAYNLQDAALLAWRSKSKTTDLVTFLAGVLTELGKANVSIQSRMNKLGEYILNLGVELGTKNPNSVFYNDLYESFSIAANLLREHQPLTYLAWIFSTEEPSELYSNNLDFTRLFITGDVAIGIYDAEGLIETIDHGRISQKAPDGSKVVLSSSTNFLYCMQEGEKLEIIIPNDKNYLIQLYGNGSTITYEGAIYTGRNLVANQVDSLTLTLDADSNVYILSRGNDTHDSTWMENMDYELITSHSMISPTVLLAMENANIFHLTFAQIKYFAWINAGLLLAFILLIIVRFVRIKVLKKKASRAVMFTMNLSISFIFMLMYEQANIYLDTVPLVRTVLGALTMFTILQLCYISMKPINRRLARVFYYAIILVAVGNFVKQYYSVDLSTLLYILGCMLITTGIVRQQRPSKKLIEIWVVLSVILSLIVCSFTHQLVIWMILYIFAICAMNVAAGHMDKRLRLIIGAFMLPSCLSVWESYTGGNVKIHTYLVLIYSVFLLIMVGFILHKSYVLEKEMTSSLDLD